MDSMELSNFHWVSISNSSYTKADCVIYCGVSVWVRAQHLGPYTIHILEVCVFVLRISCAIFWWIHKFQFVCIQASKWRSRKVGRIVWKFDSYSAGYKFFNFIFFLFSISRIDCSNSFHFTLKIDLVNAKIRFWFKFVVAAVAVVVRWPAWRWHIDIGTINDAAKMKSKEKQRTLSMIM